MHTYRTVRTGVFALIAALTMGVLAACSPASEKSGADAATRALWSAVDAGDVDAVARAIADGADIESRGANDATAVIAATKNDDAEVARVLIDAGADVNAKDGIQDSAFLYAGAEGLDEILTMTIEAGADAASINRYGGTALIPASEHGHVSTIRILLAAGVPVDHVNTLGWTAMHEAIVLGDGGPNQVEAVRLLLDAGADPSITENAGLTARQLAQQQGYDDIVAVIDAAA